MEYRFRWFIGILRETIRGFQRTKSTSVAASLAYYAFFSLFPLLLFLIGAGGYLLRSGTVYDEVVRLIGNIFPFSPDLIVKSLEQVVLRRGAVGLVGLIGLLWSASSFFDVLAENLNAAWPEARPRSFVRERLLAIEMIVVLALLLILSIGSSAFVRILPHLSLPLLGEVNLANGGIWGWTTSVIPWLLSWVLFLNLYRWVPNVPVRWAPALAGSAVAATAWQAAASAFAFYLSSGLGLYELIYGSLGAVVALLFWIYLSSIITLFGAHLTSALDRHSDDLSRQASS